MKIKPCPFCGSEARVVSCCYGSQVECSECGAMTKRYLDGMDTNRESEKKAIEAWNKRV